MTPHKWLNAPVSPSTRHSARFMIAFSLVELLVVIAVLVVLAALGLPALKNGLEAGRSAKCMANLKSIGVAVQQFAAENNGRVLTFDLDPADQGGIEDRWFQGLAATVGNTNQSVQWDGQALNNIWEQLACPCVPKKYRSWHNTTYAVNYYQDPPGIVRTLRMQRVKTPSKFLYMADGWAFFFSSKDIDNPGWPPPGSWGADLSGRPAGNSDRWVFFPHNGKCNGLFLDGHVETFSGRIPSTVIKP